MGWAVTPATVLDATGATVTDLDISIAIECVEAHINRTEGATAAMRKRDITWVRRAIQWQAAWLPGQPGYAELVKVQAQSQDGATTQFDLMGTGGNWSQILAPMAARCIRNCSWKGSRTVRPGRLPLGWSKGGLADIRSEAQDDMGDWYTP